MKERPIVMDDESVHLILAGLKEQARRVIKPQPLGSLFWNPVVIDESRGWTDAHGESWRCPFGRIGDLLWVRETWAAIWPDVDPVPLRECYIEYRADSGAPFPGGWPADEVGEETPRWQSPMHMSRWASRITLQIIDIHVRRLQDISEGDIASEGLGGLTDFVVYWNRRNAKHGYSWEFDPMVWVIEFRKTRDTEK